MSACIMTYSGFHPDGIILGGGGGGGGGGGAPGNGCGFIYFSIQLSQIFGGGGGGEASPLPPRMKPCILHDCNHTTSASVPLSQTEAKI